MPMEIIKGLEHFSGMEACAVTIGAFDGVHRGHLQIIERLKTVAAQRRICTTLVTFEPHPRLVLRPDLAAQTKLLTTADEKITALSSTGIDRLVIVNFDKAFSQIEYDVFIHSILVGKLKAAVLVIGYDHSFGKDRAGNFANLDKLSGLYGFSLVKVDPFEIDGQVINSTFIRKILQDGDITQTNDCLGRPYSFSGKVIVGKALGSELQFPTANLEIADTHKLIPGNGVYAVDVDFRAQRLKGMLNIGYKPTVTNSDERTIEVHIFNFAEQIYDQQLTVHLKKRLRNEIKFDSREALIAQLAIDKQESLKI